MPLGLRGTLHEVDWQDFVSCLKAFMEREGHCRVPPSHKENGFRLGRWVINQRHNSQRGILSELRRQQLDELGFVWDAFEADWEEGFRYLTMYKEREGDCRVARSHEENGFCLGDWVSRQRHRTVSEARRLRLDELGFVWDPSEADWEEGFRYLTVYKEREGHCRIPQSHKENSFPLGRWVANQRQSKARASQERIQRLDQLGFVWKVRRPLDR
jgi:hypothetical protein